MRERDKRDVGGNVGVGQEGRGLSGESGRGGTGMKCSREKQGPRTGGSGIDGASDIVRGDGGVVDWAGRGRGHEGARRAEGKEEEKRERDARERGARSRGKT